MPGATDELVRAFTAEGMLLNVAAAIDLPAVAHEQDWVRLCLGPMPEFLIDKATTQEGSTP